LQSNYKCPPVILNFNQLKNTLNKTKEKNKNILTSRGEAITNETSVNHLQESSTEDIENT